MPWESDIDTRWADPKLAKAARSDGSGRRKWGPERWTLIKRRLATLEAVDTLDDLQGIGGKFHALGADRAGEFAASVGGPFRMIFSPDHDPLPLLADGGLDRTAVTRVVITEVVDYHGR